MSFFVALYTSVVMSLPVQVSSLRTAYFNAAEDKNHLPTLKLSLDNYRNKDHYFYCYLSAYHSLSSKYSSSLSKKMEHFNICKKQLDQSLRLKDSFDARFVRFCIQNNTPGILGYKGQLANDKTFILKNLKTETSGEYKKKVLIFLKTCKTLSADEKEQLEKL